MKLRFAVMGIRHDHVQSLVKYIKQREDCEIVAVCEENAERRHELANVDWIEVTHGNFDTMLRDVTFEAAVIGDVFGRRGKIAEKALQAGKHVLSDKPLCTGLDELSRLKEIATRQQLKIGGMFDLRGDGGMRAARKLIQAGRIGNVQTVTFHGQHALNLKIRPRWYFEPGMHGGTLNDLAIHGIDTLMWLTGIRISAIVAARCWNAKAEPYPDFKDCAQVMMKLANNGGVLGDVSYLAAEGCGRLPGDCRVYPPGWRFTIHGTKGALEAIEGKDVMLSCDGEAQPHCVKPEISFPATFLDDFIKDIEGQPAEGGLTTEQVLYSTFVALTAQQAAEMQPSDGLINIGNPGEKK
ncbi:MAG: Gfo/Idh/MocA family oxidoreductase [Victivallales bacterium]|nr:Gfo/Idh/MocA family oxidoreductase [Victivallales bacterium]